MSEQKTTPAVDEYLETIYRLSDDGAPVQLASLAEQLNISAVSANEMVRKLAERGLASYEPYKGVALTDEGWGRAEDIVRRHRLWERFLTDVLGISWDQVHDEACRLEHATSPLVERRLAHFLAEPSTCPHGHPLPGEAKRHPAAVSLAALPLGQPARIVQIMNEESGFLRALTRASLHIGSRVEVIAVEPALRSLTVSIGGEEATLVESVAKQIRVVPLEEVFPEPRSD